MGEFPERDAGEAELADVCARTAVDKVAVLEPRGAAVERQLATLSTAEIAREAWQNYGEIILAEDLDEAAEIANKWAPEHLEIIVRDTEALFPKLRRFDVPPHPPPTSAIHGESDACEAHGSE